MKTAVIHVVIEKQSPVDQDVFKEFTRGLTEPLSQFFASRGWLIRALTTTVLADGARILRAEDLAFGDDPDAEHGFSGR